MALTTVNITGTFNFPDASFSQYAKATFQISGYDTDTEVVTPEPVTVTLGATGALSVNLWPNTGGLRGTTYRVSVTFYESSDYIRVIKTIDFGRIQVSGAANIEALLDAPVTVPNVWYNLVDLTSLTQVNFASVAAFNTAVSGGFTSPDITIVSAGSVLFQADSSASITGLPVGWVPFGEWASPHHFDTLTNAIQSGYPLDWGDDTYSHAGIVAVATSVRWKAKGATLLYTGSYQRFSVDLTVSGDSSIDGQLTIDADNKANSAIAIRSSATALTPEADRPSLTASDLTGKNCYRVGTAISGGDGIYIQGAFLNVNLIRPKAINVTMAVGAEVFAVEGVFGITVAANASLWAKHIAISDPYIDGVYSEDALYQEDQDGIRIFQDMDDPYSTCKITGSVGKNITNRFIKLHSAPNAIIDDWHYEKTTSVVPQSGLITSPVIDAQQAPATITNGRVVFDGIYNQEIIRNHTNRGEFEYGGAVTSGISGKFSNITGAGVDGIVKLVSTASGATPSPDSVYLASISDIIVDGEVAHIATIGLLGTGTKNRVSITNVIADVVTAGVAASGTATAELIVPMSGVQNFGADVPMTEGFGGNWQAVSVNCDGFSLAAPIGGSDLTLFGREVFGKSLVGVGASETDIIILLQPVADIRSTASGRLTLWRGSATSAGAPHIDFTVHKSAATGLAAGHLVHNGFASSSVSLIECTSGGVLRYGIRITALGVGTAIGQAAFSGSYFGSADMSIVAASSVTGITAFAQRSGFEQVSDFLQPVRLPPYTVATVPPVSTYARSQIWVEDEVGGAAPAYSDGTNWRRYSDGAIIS